VHEFDALAQLRGVVDDRGLRDAERGVFRGGLHEQRETQLACDADLATARKHRELRRRDTMIGEDLLRQHLVARQQHAARIAAGIGLAQQLEIGDHMLVVGHDAVELLQQVEDHVRLPFLHRVAQLGEAVAYA
jgi:hypothetical protein